MKKIGLRVLLLLACATMLGASAFADVPADLIVDHGGLQWVWADPCAPLEPSCNASGHDLTLDYGFRLPTAAEWLLWASDQEIYDAFNSGPNGELCASAYFDSGYSHCDPGDMLAGYLWGAPPPIGNADANNPASETLLVRGQGGVPEPGTILLLGTGALGIVGRIRRKLTL
jgi:hypothetical protein